MISCCAFTPFFAITCWRPCWPEGCPLFWPIKFAFPQENANPFSHFAMAHGICRNLSPLPEQLRASPPPCDANPCVQHPLEDFPSNSWPRGCPLNISFSAAWKTQPAQKKNSSSNSSWQLWCWWDRLGVCWSSFNSVCSSSLGGLGLLEASDGVWDSLILAGSLSSLHTESSWFSKSSSGTTSAHRRQINFPFLQEGADSGRN